jgi:hypothetical protein
LELVPASLPALQQLVRSLSAAQLWQLVGQRRSAASERQQEPAEVGLAQARMLLVWAPLAAEAEVRAVGPCLHHLRDHLADRQIVVRSSLILRHETADLVRRWIWPEQARTAMARYDNRAARTAPAQQDHLPSHRLVARIWQVPDLKMNARQLDLLLPPPG